MPRSPTTTSSSIDDANHAPDNQNNSTSASSTRSINKRSSRMRFSFQKAPSRTQGDESWENADSRGGTKFNLVGEWFRSFRSKRKEDKVDGQDAHAGPRSSSPPRLPELGLDGARLEFLPEDTGEFSTQQR
ncbi:hypothetical protein N7478_002376 [Penicillium angulare]|uniref:uncharacterized protein n=1 Tax=Penicillium angulare TaxID=116970 RepID=UPI0025400877|nr:uncharacterized protein N7478_002376 [Penicillium angulare]KAJ5286690.1 hypothetical protein N7478_002376 [Penicillium angulare]